jgi:hypothetical protein
MCVPSSVDLLCTVSRADEGPKSESTQLYSTKLYSTFSTVLYSSVLYSTLFYSTLLFDGTYAIRISQDLGPVPLTKVMGHLDCSDRVVREERCRDRASAAILR